MTTGPQYPAVGGDASRPPARRPPDDAPQSWRVQHSMWLLLPVFNLAWIGFIVTGRLAHARKWLVWAVAYGVIPAGLLVTAGASGSRGLAVAAVLAYLATWMGGIAHGAVINGEYLRRTWDVQTGRLVTGRGRVERPAVTPGPVTPAPLTTQAPTSVTAARQARTVALARGPRFPRASLATVTAIDEILQPVLAEGRSDKLTEPQRQRVEQIVSEYLPQSVEGFLRFPDTFLAEVGRRQHYTTLLDQQLGALLDAARTLQTSVFADEADEFEANGRYLRDKFGRSSLDLDQP